MAPPEVVPLRHSQLSLPSLRSLEASCGRGRRSSTGCSFMRSVWCVRDCSERYVSPSSLHGRKMVIEKLWRDFFSDPSQWWDHRSEKENLRYPDFKHKMTQQALWVIDSSNPPWVELELAAMAPGSLQSHNFSWHVRLRRHVKAGDYKKTLNLFQQMKRESIILDKYTFVPVLKACSNLKILEEGRRVHAQIIERGYECDIDVVSNLVDMYAKCGSIEDAWSVFNKMREHVVSWNAMIRGYVTSGQGLKAIELFKAMQLEGLESNSGTFVGVLNACASVAALEEGRRVHNQIIRNGCEANIYVGTCLVDMYAKCGNIEDAWNVFNKMRERNVVSWSAMIGGYVKSGNGLKSIELFWEMQRERVEPNAVSFVGVLNACASVAALEEGRRVHEQIIARGYESDGHVANSLVDMYAKSGSIDDAWSVFNNMRQHDVVSWNAMIGGYVKSQQGLKAIELFRKMQQDLVKPDAVTFVGLLKACTSVTALEEGRHVHLQIIRKGFESDLYVLNCLVDMYAKCGSIGDAYSVFIKMRERDLISWNAMIGGYVKSGEALKALELFREMRLVGLEPNAVTFVGILTACASVSSFEEGRRVHEEVRRRGYESDLYVGTCLVDMYAKCGSIGDAWSVFNKMREHNVVSWSAMIGGYVKSGQGLKAIELFQQMQQEGVEPNIVTYVGVLNACASVAALEEGKRIHGQIIEKGCESDIYVANCLVDMYAKCGSIEDAWSVFNKIREYDVVSWTAMMGGCAMHGDAKKAIELFKRMAKEGIKIDGIAFTCLLSACSHGGLVKEGLRYFKFMTSCSDMVPTLEHYACVVDLLGRAGRLEEAEELTKRMPVEADVSVWMSLLAACRIHGNVKMAERAAKRCWELDGDNASGHVLLSNLYAASGRRDSIADFEEQMKRRLWKEPCRSWIEVNNMVHSFVAKECQPPEILEIHAELERLSVHMIEAGYVPDTRFSVHGQKQTSHLYGHSENVPIGQYTS